MKKYGYLYEKITSDDNLELAYKNASKYKHSRCDVVEFTSNKKENLKRIRCSLIDKTYTVSKYKTRRIKEKKKWRDLNYLPFEDNIVQWAIMQIIDPIWLSSMTTSTYANIKNRGIHPCLYRMWSDMRNDKVGTYYCLQLDYYHFYPWISHDILKMVVRKKIKDKDLLWLLDLLIDSVPPEIGVPLGNYVSPYFANMYLTELDHFLKEIYKVRYYYRYADDIIILSNSKEYLRGVLLAINHYSVEFRSLILKSNWQIYPVDSRGIDFLGYVSYHDHVLLRKSIKKNFCRKLASLKDKNLTDKQLKRAVCGYLGWAKHCNSKNLLRVLDMAKISEVAKVSGGLTGDKMSIEEVLNKHVKITAYEITPSKYHGECIKFQFLIEELVKHEDGSESTEWVQRIVFLGSTKLIEQMKGAVIDPNDPADAKFIKQNLPGNRFFYKLIDP